MTPAERDHAQAINEFEGLFGSPQDWVGCARTWREYERAFLAHHPADAAADVTDPSSIGGES